MLLLLSSLDYGYLSGDLLLGTSVEYFSPLSEEIIDGACPNQIPGKNGLSRSKLSIFTSKRRFRHESQ